MLIAVAVTPHVGVWIETYLDYMHLTSFFVTPHVGVWIETEHACNASSDWRSHLM